MCLHHPGNIFVYICTYSMTQHLDRFYGCCCENKVWHWVLFFTHLTPQGVESARHLWDSFRQLLVIASIGSGISTGNGHTLCTACHSHFLYIIYTEVSGSILTWKDSVKKLLTLNFFVIRTYLDSRLADRNIVDHCLDLAETFENRKTLWSQPKFLAFVGQL